MKSEQVWIKEIMQTQVAGAAAAEPSHEDMERRPLYHRTVSGTAIERLLSGKESKPC